MKKTIVAASILFLGIWASAAFAQDWVDVVANLEEQVMKLEKNVAKLDASHVSKLEKRLTNLDAAYRRDIAEIRQQAGVSTAAGDITGLKESLVSLTARVGQLQDNVHAQAYDIDRTAQIEEQLVQLLIRIEAWEEQSAEYADINIPGVNPASATPSESTVGVENLEITGFFDGSYFVDVASGDNTFGFDQAEVDLEKTIGSVGSARVDVEWSSDGAGGFDLDAEQGYVTFSPQFLGPVNLTFGKFNAPIGFELLDAPDMYQYSHALVFDYGLPTNLSGAMFSADFGAGLDLSFYLCNGWDQNVDINTGKTLGGRFGFSYGDWGATGLSAIWGAQASSEGDHLTVIDWDLCVNPLPFWTIGAEVNYGINNVNNTNLNWFGFLLMNHWDYTNWGGVTLRFDYFDDTDALRFGSGLTEKRQAIAVAPTFGLGNGMGALIEVRTDFSNKEVFTDSDGNPSKSSVNFAYEMTYSF